MMMMMDDTTTNTIGIDDFDQDYVITISSTPEESSGSNYDEDDDHVVVVDPDNICESNSILWIKKNRQPSPPFPPLSVLRYGLKDMKWLGEKKCHLNTRNVVVDRFVIPVNIQVVIEEFMTEEEKKKLVGGGLKVKVVDRFGRKRSIVLKKCECNERYLLCKGWKEFVSKWVSEANSIDSSLPSPLPPPMIVQMWCSRLPADKKFKLSFGFDFISASST